MPKIAYPSKGGVSQLWKESRSSPKKVAKKGKKKRR